MSECWTCGARPKSVFAGLDKEQSCRLDSLRVVVELRPGDKLFEQGRPFTGVYCIGTGLARISRYFPFLGRELAIDVRGPGDFTGFLLAGQESSHYANTGTAIGPMRVCYFSPSSLERIASEFPSFHRHIVSQFMARVNAYERRICAAQFLSSRQKVAWVIHDLATRFGQPVRSEKVGPGFEAIPAGLSRKDLAAIAGMTLEQFVRTIGDLAEEGIIAKEGRAILVTDRERLLSLFAEALERVPGVSTPRPRS